MKKSLSIWSFPPALDLKGKLKLAREAGYDGFEIDLSEGGPVTPNSTASDLAEVRQASDRAGVPFSGLATGLFWSYSLTSNDGTKREKAAHILKRQIECAAALGVEAILVVPGCVYASFIPDCEVVSYETCYQRAKQQIGAIVKLAEKHRVRVGLENVWNQFLVSPLEFRDFVDGFGSEWIGAYFDVGNTLATGFPDQWIEVLDRRIFRVHFKDFRRSVGTINGFVDLLAGDVDWPVVMDSLRTARYDGWCTGEMVPTYALAPEVLVHNTARAMDAIFKMGKK